MSKSFLVHSKQHQDNQVHTTTFHNCIAKFLFEFYCCCSMHKREKRFLHFAFVLIRDMNQPTGTCCFEQVNLVCPPILQNHPRLCDIVLPGNNNKKVHKDLPCLLFLFVKH